MKKLQQQTNCHKELGTGRKVPNVSLKGIYLYALVMEDDKTVELIRYNLQSRELTISYVDYREPKVVKIDGNMPFTDFINNIVDMRF